MYPTNSHPRAWLIVGPRGVQYPEHVYRTLTDAYAVAQRVTATDGIVREIWFTTYVNMVYPTA